VKDAVAAGKIVTISQSTISYKGWTGAGYSIVDPNTGTGAYLIGGGADGGFTTFAEGAFTAAKDKFLNRGRLRKRNLKHVKDFAAAVVA
jgi:hypothetical protein